MIKVQVERDRSMAGSVFQRRSDFTCREKKGAGPSRPAQASTLQTRTPEMSSRDAVCKHIILCPGICLNQTLFRTITMKFVGLWLRLEVPPISKPLLYNSIFYIGWRPINIQEHPPPLDLIFLRQNSAKLLNHTSFTRAPVGHSNEMS